MSKFNPCFFLTRCQIFYEAFLWGKIRRLFLNVFSSVGVTTAIMKNNL